MRRGFRLPLLAALAATALTVGGCGLLGLIAGRTLPRPKEPAAFDLGERPTAVRVTADEAIMGESALTEVDVVAGSLARALAKGAGATVVTDPSRAARVVELELRPAGEARIIGGGYPRASAAGVVRVLDAGGGEIWPDDGSAGRAVAAEFPRATRATPGEARRAALVALGEAASRLFYAQPLDELRE